MNLHWPNLCNLKGDMGTQLKMLQIMIFLASFALAAESVDPRICAPQTTPSWESIFNQAEQKAGVSSTSPIQTQVSSKINPFQSEAQNFNSILEQSFRKIRPSDSADQKVKKMESYLSLLDRGSKEIAVNAITKGSNVQEIQSEVAKHNRKIYELGVELQNLVTPWIHAKDSIQKAKAKDRILEFIKIKGSQGESTALIDDLIKRIITNNSQKELLRFSSEWLSSHPQARWSEFLLAANDVQRKSNLIGTSNADLWDLYLKIKWPMIEKLPSEFDDLKEQARLMIFSDKSADEINNYFQIQNHAREIAAQEAQNLINDSIKEQSFWAQYTDAGKANLAKKLSEFINAKRALHFSEQYLERLVDIAELQRLEQFRLHAAEWLKENPTASRSDILKSPLALEFTVKKKIDEDRFNQWLVYESFIDPISRLYRISKEKGYILGQAQFTNEAKSARDEIEKIWAELRALEARYKTGFPLRELEDKIKRVQKEVFYANSLQKAGPHGLAGKSWASIQKSGILNYFSADSVRLKIVNEKIESIFDKHSEDVRNRFAQIELKSNKKGVFDATTFENESNALHSHIDLSFKKIQQSLKEISDEYPGFLLSAEKYKELVYSSFEAFKNRSFAKVQIELLEAQNKSWKDIEKIATENAWAKAKGWSAEDIRTYFYLIRFQKQINALSAKTQQAGEFWSRIESSRKLREDQKFSPTEEWMRTPDPLNKDAMPLYLMQSKDEAELKFDLESWIRSEKNAVAETLAAQPGISSYASADEISDRMYQKGRIKYWLEYLKTQTEFKWPQILQELKKIGLSQEQAGDEMIAYLKAEILSGDRNFKSEQLKMSSDDRFSFKNTDTLNRLIDEENLMSRSINEISKATGSFINRKDLAIERFNARSSARAEIESWKTQNKVSEEQSWALKGRKIAHGLVHSIGDTAFILESDVVWLFQGEDKAFDRYLRQRESLTEWINAHYGLPDGAVLDGFSVNSPAVEYMQNNPVVWLGKGIQQLAWEPAKVAAADIVELSLFGTATTTSQELSDLENSADAVISRLSKGGRWIGNGGFIILGTVATGGLGAAGATSISLEGLSLGQQALLLTTLTGRTAAQIAASRSMRVIGGMSFAGAAGGEILRIQAVNEALDKGLMDLERNGTTKVPENFTDELGAFDSISQMANNTYDGVAGSMFFVTGVHKIGQVAERVGELGSRLNTAAKMNLAKIAQQSGLAAREIKVLRDLKIVQRLNGLEPTRFSAASNYHAQVGKGFGEWSRGFIDMTEGLSDFPDTIEQFDLKNKKMSDGIEFWKEIFSLKNAGVGLMLGSNMVDTFDMSLSNIVKAKNFALDTARAVKRVTYDQPRDWYRAHAQTVDSHEQSLAEEFALE